MKPGISKLIIRCAAFVAAMSMALNAYSQSVDSVAQEYIAITARPEKGVITLRWAPLTYKVWQHGNQLGYRVERYIVSQNGRLLLEPRKKILWPSMTPVPQDQWETIVKSNRYGAIAAQALFGDRFEVDLQRSDLFAIVDKVRENEQRFAFALFSADMSAEVAAASGLLFKDTTVVVGEKYLYRVIINSADTLRGSIFIGPGDPYELPVPANLKAEFKDHFVFLKWDRAIGSPYTAYLVERSEGESPFETISETPLVTVSPQENADNRYEYATDSLSDVSRTYRYRIRGLTPFGEKGPAAIVTGTSIPRVEQVPFIEAAESVNNNSIVIHWTFPETSNHAITGFFVERAPSPGQRYLSLTKEQLDAGTRRFEDLSPNQTNYYRVRAQGLDGAWYSSHDYFAQLIDSIPPTAPSGLKGTVDDMGKVRVTWEPNGDHDIFGYRVYKAFHSSEELTQVTQAPIQNSFFTDSVDLNTLNENLLYCVMAVDINQNHSSLSEPLKISVPDKIKPQPPVLLPTSARPDGIGISWIPGGSEDIVAYHVFRKARGADGWVQIKTVEASGDSIYSCIDHDAPSGQATLYTVLSIDDAGLESEPAVPISAVRIEGTLRPAVKWKRPRMNREENEIRLSWDYAQQPIQSFRLFRSVNNGPALLFCSLTASESGYTDIITPGRTYSYWIMAVFEGGNKSSLSEELKFVY